MKEILIWAIIAPLLILGAIPGFIFTQIFDQSHTDIYTWAFSSIVFGFVILVFLISHFS